MNLCWLIFEPPGICSAPCSKNIFDQHQLRYFRACSIHGIVTL